jgi:hypothetical protein
MRRLFSTVLSPFRSLAPTKETFENVNTGMSFHCTPPLRIPSIIAILLPRFKGVITVQNDDATIHIRTRADPNTPDIWLVEAHDAFALFMAERYQPKQLYPLVELDSERAMTAFRHTRTTAPAPAHDYLEADEKGDWVTFAVFLQSVVKANKQGLVTDSSGENYSHNRNKLIQHLLDAHTNLRIGQIRAAQHAAFVDPASPQEGGAQEDEEPPEMEDIEMEEGSDEEKGGFSLSSIGGALFGGIRRRLPGGGRKPGLGRSQVSAAAEVQDRDKRGRLVQKMEKALDVVCHSAADKKLLDTRRRAEAEAIAKPRLLASATPASDVFAFQSREPEDTVNTVGRDHLTRMLAEDGHTADQMPVLHPDENNVAGLLAYAEAHPEEYITALEQVVKFAISANRSSSYVYVLRSRAGEDRCSVLCSIACISAKGKHFCEAPRI